MKPMRRCNSAHEQNLLLIPDAKNFRSAQDKIYEWALMMQNNWR